MANLRYPGEDWLFEITVLDVDSLPIDFSVINEIIVNAEDERGVPLSATLTKTGGGVTQGTGTNDVRFEFTAQETSRFSGDVTVQMNYFVPNINYSDGVFNDIVQFIVKTGQKI